MFVNNHADEGHFDCKIFRSFQRKTLKSNQMLIMRYRGFREINLTIFVRLWITKCWNSYFNWCWIRTYWNNLEFEREKMKNREPMRRRLKNAVLKVITINILHFFSYSFMKMMCLKKKNHEEKKRFFSQFTILLAV